MAGLRPPPSPSQSAYTACAPTPLLLLSLPGGSVSLLPALPVSAPTPLLLLFFTAHLPAAVQRDNTFNKTFQERRPLPPASKPPPLSLVT